MAYTILFQSDYHTFEVVDNLRGSWVHGGGMQGQTLWRRGTGGGGGL